VDDALLLGREKLLPKRVKPRQGFACIFFGKVGRFLRAASQPPATISGWRSRARTWPITAPSICAAEIRRRMSSLPVSSCFNTRCAT
jgi:hypothetical protein